MVYRALHTVIAGLLIASVFSNGVQAAGAGRFTAVNPSELPGKLRLPPGLDTTQVTVVVLLGGDPVAVVQEAAGRKLTDGEKQGVKGQRQTEQSAIRPQIEAAGGRIIGAYQSAVNGLKVQIPSNKVGALRQIAGVVDVKGVNKYERGANVTGVPRVQAPAVWTGLPAYRGEGIKIAVIDTGIDYTHANFGGPGTVAAYQSAFSKSNLPADPAYFGPLAPRVKGGIDLSGDAYDANDPNSVPQPDPNPLDCADHGSHVAGTVAGSGVLSNGQTFPGPYDTTTYNHSFRIGPGVAPKANLYAVRVFGCQGTTNLVVEALNWAVENDMDVVNLSLGSDYGTPDSADALAADNAVRAGVVVVASAGNSGDLRYVTGSPASSSRAISVAATTTVAQINFANLALPAGGGDTARTISAINANDAIYASPLTGMVKVVRDGALATSPVSLGCSLADFQANGGVAGKIAVVNRGVCARVAKAVYGQQAGAIAVVMINNANGLPPYEGSILQNPDTGQNFTVTIPFLGVTSSSGSRLVLRDGLSIPITVGTPQVTGVASFSSGGPRNGDSALKPDISAPGNPITSTLAGSGNAEAAFSGTSMAAPHVAGVAALVQQAHPTWKPADIKAAIINSGDPSKIGGYLTHTAGSGFVNAAAAAHTQVIAYGDTSLTSLNFGLQEFSKDYTDQKAIKLHNAGNSDVTFNVAAVLPQGSPHTATLDKTQVRVRANEDVDLKLTLKVPAATAGNSDAFRDVAGLVTFTPTSASQNGGIALRLPYYLVPRVSSNVAAELGTEVRASSPNGTVKLSNKESTIPATADFYSWGLDASGNGSTVRNPAINLSAAGVQSFLLDTEQLLVFAVTTAEGWSSPSTREFDFYVDTNGDGVPDYAVVGVDIGMLTTGDFDGRIAAAVFNLATGDATVDFLATASTDSSTMLIPVLASRLGLSAASNPRITYTATGYDFTTGFADSFAKTATYNAFSSAVSDGQFVSLPANGSASVPFSVNVTEWAKTPALGLMVVTQDNKNGKNEANLVKVELKK